MASSSPLLSRVSYFRIWQEAWDYASAKERATIIFYHTMYALAVIVQLIQPYLVGKLVNVLQTGGPHLFDDAKLLLAQIVLVNFSFWALHGPARVIERKTAKSIYITYTTQCYKRLAELPLDWHQDHHSGAVINRIQTTANGLQSFVENGFISFQNLWHLIGSIAMLLWFNLTLGLFSLGGFVASMALIVVMNRYLISALHANNEAAHTANATFYDFVSNMVSIIILRLQKFSERTLHSKLNLSMPPWIRQIRLNEWRYFIYSMLNILMMAGILLGYIKMQLDTFGVVAAGSLVTVYLYQDKIGNQGFGFLSVHSEWLRALANLAATKNILADHARLAKPAAPAPTDAWQELNIRGLHFSYRTDEGKLRPVLRNIDFPLRRGERIALLGSSGSGKSTLLSLLRSLHTPQQAELYVDGQPVPFDTLSEVTTLIPQDPEIFENSIRFNISFDMDVPDETIYQAARLAEFMPVLEQLPNRSLDTDIREKGVNLSVGQRQRLALARGIFAAEQADIILLDEPTSSVDLPTEERIFNNIFSHFKGRTIVATLHRLHLLPMFDRIVYLDEGRVLLDLPVREALSAKGPVRDLYIAYQQQKTA